MGQLGGGEVGTLGEGGIGTLGGGELGQLGGEVGTLGGGIGTLGGGTSGGWELGRLEGGGEFKAFPVSPSLDETPPVHTLEFHPPQI